MPFMDDDDLFEYKLKLYTEKKKRKRNECSCDLEEGEIEENKYICKGFFFDVSVMKRVRGTVECHSGNFCNSCYLIVD